MSDSFEDLWSSSAPIPPKQKPQTLASASVSGRPGLSSASSSKSDVFALLASSNTGGSSQQRYGSSSLGGTVNSGARSTTPGSRPMSALGGAGIPSVGGRSSSSTPAPLGPKPLATSQKGGNDAFSDLFSSSAGSGSNGHSNMTLASRLAMEARQKSQGASSADQIPTQPGETDAWAGLDALGGGSSFKPTPMPSEKRNIDNDDDWGLGDFGSSTTASTKPPKPRPAIPASKPTTSSGKSLWDIHDFAAPVRPAASSSQSGTTVDEHFDTPDDDFDFGSREDAPPHGYSQPRSRQQRTGLLELDDGDLDPEDAPNTATGLLGHVDHGQDDDFLGVLAKPVEEVKRYHPSSAMVSQSGSPAQSSISPQMSSSSGLPRRQTNSSNSPPPHILGQIVEMGFSVDQARESLAKTSNGQDVQDALEMLLNGGSGAGTSRQPPQRAGPDERSSEPPRRNAPKGFKERERERMERNRRERERDESGGGTVTDVQEQADRLLSQATEIGQSVWTKASAFWKEGKEKVAKAYEERAASAATSSSTDGRPKWMQSSSPEDLRNGDDSEWIPPRPKPKPKPQMETFIDKAPTAPPEAEVDLFDTSSSQPPPSSSIPRQRPRPPSQSRSKPTLSTPPPPITRDRPLPSIPSSTLSTALRYKTAGTDQFKLGQYGPAIESYTAAINALPDGHLLLVPLFTNRSLAKMRNGEYKGAVDDAGGALSIILVAGGQSNANGVHEFDPTGSGNSGPQVTATSWSPSIEPAQVVSASQQKLHNGGWQHPQGLGVDLVDGFVKALRRRAEGLEGREKWNDALKDWEVLSALGWVQESIRMEAQRGGARCRKMVDDGSRGSANSNALPGLGSAPRNPSIPSRPPKPPPPKSKPKPVSAPAAPGAALLALKATNAQAEVDDTLKHQLKDSIDSKLSAWRTGKESNVRALLASLDLVLWEEILKGAKVGGLHELITPIQVKKAYMKAIGRVHPDKLNAQNSTVEQRMLANGVFGTLNEAWIAFQNA
ncbi:hypothetical protein CPB83DRAFT_877582 [Crepidotus variabilis]|uniref:UBA domain-containing protein n=1 Tax=Crepidotus variabilis TaxID=179855 RepID=A0A9P6E8X5_9AGAR|nr:hypothetical protein CPB83DRAFT_877582 [Crepidotus variabilis]